MGLTDNDEGKEDSRSPATRSEGSTASMREPPGRASRSSASGGPGSRLEANVPLVMKKVETDLDLAVAEAERRTTAALRGALAVMAPIACGALHYVGHHDGRKHVRRVVEIHIAASRDAPRFGIERAIERHLPDALAHDDFLTRMNWNHPAAPEASGLVTASFRKRIPHVARLLHDGTGSSYEDLVRSTHKIDEVDAVLDSEFATGRSLLAMAEKERGLLRIPRPFLPTVLNLARGMLEWYETRARDEVKRIYG